MVSGVCGYLLEMGCVEYGGCSFCVCVCVYGCCRSCVYVLGSVFVLGVMCVSGLGVVCVHCGFECVMWPMCGCGHLGVSCVVL